MEQALDVGRVVSDFGGMPFEDSQMSRRHATFRLVGDQVVVEDGGGQGQSGSGDTIAAPIAKQVMEAVLGQ